MVASQEGECEAERTISLLQLTELENLHCRDDLQLF